MSLNFTNIESRRRFFRLANYIAASQLYLRDNFFLEVPLREEHIKKRILGHWWTVPGINFIYLHLNLLAERYHQKTLLVTGPGHGYPALLSNLYLEGTLGDFYPHYALGRVWMSGVIKDFSWPGGFPSHANPETPGAILEGGELGYSLSTAYGAAFDHPDLLVAAIVGDGEAETGPLATSWHSNKFLNPIKDGAVLPIVHINKYKISGPTLFGSMSRRELENYFIGLGYDPIIVHASDGGIDPFVAMDTSMEYAYLKIQEIQSRARNEWIIQTPRWPVILFISKKGWTGPREFHGKMVEDSFRSHGIPLTEVHDNADQFNALKAWLESYDISELVDETGKPAQDILDIVPSDAYKLGKVSYANGGSMRIPLVCPEIANLAAAVSDENRGEIMQSSTHELGVYLRDIIMLNPKNFRVMSPDETESNKLGVLFDVTKRCFLWPTPPGSENIWPDGRVMEILSEHTLQGWMQGYILTGGHSIFITYEAFAMIVASMVNQYNKFLIQSESIAWRKPVSSMNFVLTSTSWRQDHNGFSHQNPGFVSSQLNNQSPHVRVYYPLDANSTLVILENVLKTTNRINIIVAGKTDLPQFITLEEAQKTLHTGIMELPWAGNNPENPDIVFVATGDYVAQETFAALQILREIAPELHTRCIYVSEISCVCFGAEHSHCLTLEHFEQYFSTKAPIIYSYHGYRQDLEQLLFGHPHANRFEFHGYQANGTTTTPFDMFVRNKSSRYDLVISALQKVQKYKPELVAICEKFEQEFSELLVEHKRYIQEHGDDLPVVKNFTLKFRQSCHSITKFPIPFVTFYEKSNQNHLGEQNSL